MNILNSIALRLRTFTRSFHAATPAQPGTGPINKLPPELLTEILGHLDRVDLANAERACKSWEGAAQPLHKAFIRNSRPHVEKVQPPGSYRQRAGLLYGAQLALQGIADEAKPYERLPGTLYLGVNYFRTSKMLFVHWRRGGRLQVFKLPSSYRLEVGERDAACWNEGTKARVWPLQLEAVNAFHPHAHKAKVWVRRSKELSALELWDVKHARLQSKAAWPSRTRSFP